MCSTGHAVGNTALHCSPTFTFLSSLHLKKKKNHAPSSKHSFSLLHDPSLSLIPSCFSLIILPATFLQLKMIY